MLAGSTFNSKIEKAIFKSDPAEDKAAPAPVRRGIRAPGTELRYQCRRQYYPLTAVYVVGEVDGGDTETVVVMLYYVHSSGKGNQS